METVNAVNLTETGQALVDELLATRRRELELMNDLTDEQIIGPSYRIIEPPIWELGHVGWFQDRWILQNLDKSGPVDPAADKLYDSFNIPNAERWQLLFPSRGQTYEYITDILERVIQRLEGREPSHEEIYFYTLALNHEAMHSETMTHIRQTLAYPRPRLSTEAPSGTELFVDLDFEPHDVSIPGGVYQLGAAPGMPFVFDNEKWAHPVKIEPFKISVTPVTMREYRKFVEAGGYEDKSLWSDEGRAWLEQNSAHQPVFWKNEDGRWLRRAFVSWLPVEEFLPMIHVNWFEANAYCAWAGRRLPTEAEWELAASVEPAADEKGFTERKRIYPWGDEPPALKHANLDSRWLDVVDVRAFPEGDSAFGLRQMIGNVWEWTADTFDAYPGYVIDPYDTYSAPSFGQQKVLRGGCFATRPLVIRNTFRNFYTPDRNNIFAGFRTVAL